MIAKSGHRFSEKIMRSLISVIPKGGAGFLRRSCDNSISEREAIFGS